MPLNVTSECRQGQHGSSFIKTHSPFLENQKLWVSSEPEMVHTWNYFIIMQLGKQCFVIVCGYTLPFNHFKINCIDEFCWYTKLEQDTYRI